LDVYWNIVELPGIKVVPSQRSKEFVEKLLKALNDRSIDFVDLVNASQYDLSTKRPRGDVSASINKISRATKTNRKVILKETSASYMFAIAVFYAIKDLDSSKGGRTLFLIEPRLELGSSSCTYDYAIYDPEENALKVIAEVKRLRSLANIMDYLEAFANKTEECLAIESIHQYIHQIVLHIHLTPEILKEYRGLKELLLGLSKVIQLSKCRVTLITSSGGGTDEFVQALRDQLQHFI